MMGNIKKLKTVVVGEHKDFSSRFSRILEETTLSDFEINNFSDAFESLKFIESYAPDLVYVGPCVKNADISDFYRWLGGIDKNEGVCIICHLDGESGVEFEQLDMILGSDVNDVLVGNMSEDEILARLKRTLSIHQKQYTLINEKRKLEVESLKDDLTGLSNMKGFKTRYKSLFSALEKRAIPGIATYMLDLDRFKSVNDSYNHMVGSYIIKEVGRILNDIPAISEFEVKARYGGDEYVISLACKNASEAAAYGDKICEMIRQAVFSFDGYNLNVTASVGACFTSNSTYSSEKDLLKGADLMLYKSKEGGRDQSNLLVLSLDNEVAMEEKKRADKLLPGSELSQKLNSLT